MKIDSIDIRSFDAKQLTVDFEPPQTGVTVEMFDGALIPSESETYTPLSGLTVLIMGKSTSRGGFSETKRTANMFSRWIFDTFSRVLTMMS